MTDPAAPSSQPIASDLELLFPGSGEMARLIREKDWSRSPLGDPRTWPDPLLQAINILLGSNYPMEIWWGPEYLRFYNDAYRPLLGPDRHPHFLGRPGRECWAELWDEIGPMLDGVMQTGIPTYAEDSLLLMTRKGFLEETYVTWSYGPIRSRQGEIGGIFCACDETTQKVLSRRRLATLSELGLNGKDSGHGIAAAVEVLARNPADVPFALVYQADKGGQTATLLGQTGVTDPGLSPGTIALDTENVPWSLQTVRATGQPLVIPQDGSDRPRAVVFPLHKTEHGTCAAVILGVSPRLELDEEYGKFLELVARHIGTTLAAASVRERIEQERFRLKSAFLRSPAFTCILLGPDHVFDFVNERYDQLVGRRDLLGKPVAEALPEIRSQGFLSILDTVYQTGKPYMSKKTSLLLQKTADGPPEETVVDFVFEPIEETDGSISGIFVHGIDISEEVKGGRERETLLQSEKAARAEAERTSRMKDEFLATLSHELRTPLNAILGWANVLRAGQPPGSDLVAGLETIERNARAQTRIIEDLLDMSSIISGKARLDIRPFNLPEVLREAIQTVQAAADAKGIRIQTALDPCPDPVLGDPNRLQQVFWNILNNAIKFTDLNGRVQVWLTRVDSHVEIGVSDSGRGIKAELLPQVFDRFQQGDSSTTRKYGGLGLGLAIVKQLVELHGGSVRATSAGEGRGATFAIRLPLTTPPAGPLTREPLQTRAGFPQPSDHSLADLRVLVIDDQVDARALAGRVLSQAGASVLSAGSVTEGLHFLKASDFDVVVCDIGMPGRDGYNFIRTVRSWPEPKGNIPAVALTAYARDRDRNRALHAGFQMHVAKPVEPGELVLVVARLAGRTAV